MTILGLLKQPESLYHFSPIKFHSQLISPVFIKAQNPNFNILTYWYSYLKQHVTMGQAGKAKVRRGGLLVVQERAWDSHALSLTVPKGCLHIYRSRNCIHRWQEQKEKSFWMRFIAISRPASRWARCPPCSTRWPRPSSPGRSRAPCHRCRVRSWPFEERGPPPARLPLPGT